MVQDDDYRELPSEFDSEVRLQIRDAADIHHKRSVKAILYVESPTNSLCDITNPDEGLSTTIEAPFSAGLDQRDLREVKAEQPELLHAQVYWNGDFQYGPSMEAMTEATKDNDAIFVFVTLNWKPSSAESVSPFGEQATAEEKLSAIPAADNSDNNPITPETDPAGFLMLVLTHQHGDVSNLLKVLISDAAGITTEEWEEFVYGSTDSMDNITGEPLSKVLLNLNPAEAAQINPDVLHDFRLMNGNRPRSTEFQQAMSVNQVPEYYSLLQPDNIQLEMLDIEPNSNGIGGRITGTATFESAKLYTGSVRYVVEVDADNNMIVTKFELPNYGIAIGRGLDGTWQRIEPTTDSASAAQAVPTTRDEDRAMMDWMIQVDRKLKQTLVDEALARGDAEAAADVLARAEAQIDPKAKAWVELAMKFEASKEFTKAANAWLEAYRITPSLLDDQHLPMLKQAGRIHELVDVLTEERLLKLGYENRATKVVRFLLKDEATRADGYVLLRRIWSTRPDTHFDLLRNRPDEIWTECPVTADIIRFELLHEGIAEEVGGWDRFTIKWFGARGGSGSGVPDSLLPLMSSMQNRESALRNLAVDVEAATARFPKWRAGLAVLSVLEAERGNDQRAVELMNQLLSDTNHAIPPGSAWTFGKALEGRSEDLDRVVIRLYEVNVAGERDPASPLRETAIGSLARLYWRSGQNGRALRLLSRLSEAEGGSVVCAWGRIPKNKNRCMECHKSERNLENYILMSNSLTDIGYPVDARLSLARINASFSNAYGSDKVWANAYTSAPDWEYQGEEAFQPARAKAEQAITPRSIVEALDRGVLAGQQTDGAQLVVGHNPPDFPRLKLMTGVRGERGKSTLFSPVIDILVEAAEHSDSDSQLAKLDEKLTFIPPGHRKSLDEIIAVTVLSFARDRLNEAKLRTEQALAYVEDREVKPIDVGLWFIAQRALRHEATRAAGEQLADRARKAALAVGIPAEALRQ